MIYLTLVNLGGLELLFLAGFLLLILIFFLGYYIGKDRARKKNQ